MHPARKVYKNRKDHEHTPEYSPAIMAEVQNFLVPPELKTLVDEKKLRQKKILEIGNRLRFGYSDALHDYQLELIKEDAKLSCKMITIWASGPS
jgi:hypothetical protein